MQCNDLNLHLTNDNLMKMKRKIQRKKLENYYGNKKFRQDYVFTQKEVITHVYTYTP